MSEPTHWITEATDPSDWRQRLLANSERRGECLAWIGWIDRDGYGVFRVPGRRQTGAHRASWLAFRGPIPPGLVVDHLCRNRRCINVDHLEVVTTKVNIQRGETGRGGRLDAQCSAGHPRTDANTLTTTRKDGRVIRVCRPCRRERVRRWMERRAA